jgi:hypothetical protein
MDKLIISPTHTTPEIRFSVEDNIFQIRGNSRPEDVRALYYPVIEWIKELADNIISNKINIYSKENPLRFHVDLLYFNSSSAKFLYDIFSELKRLSDAGITLIVEWVYEKEDIDMLDAGKDIALLAEMEFTYIEKEVD